MVIIDTGPIVSLFDESESTHQICKETLKDINSGIMTSWPVLTESFYLLEDWQKGQNELWNFIIAGGLNIYEIPASDHNRIRWLMEKYSDNPMDLADATLVAIAETHKIKTIFTLDRNDFSKYRPKHCTHFEIIP
ncbi:PIN domain-containing protein [Candidatus Desantisbacteria bacterium]|nr:PIN domain-containing protein [Candidatus Desantisbacteria bacterium]